MENLHLHILLAVSGDAKVNIIHLFDILISGKKLPRTVMAVRRDGEM
jgi:hypothetical protein